MRELHDGLLLDLRRVHGEISGLLARTGTRLAQALTTTDPELKIRPHKAARETGQQIPPWSPSTSSLTLAGLGNENVLVTLTATADPTTTCTNQVATRRRDRIR